MRYESKDLSIIAINLPSSLTYEEFYTNAKIRDMVSKVVDQVRPDIAHIHSIQTMGGGVLEALEDLDIPIAVTVHDCWWICERQFMIKKNNKYCYQEKIDLNICARCVDDPQKSLMRFDYLNELLQRMDCLFFPSEFQMQLFLKNGYDSKRIKETFSKLDRSDYELVLVDAAQNVNTTWAHDFNMDIAGTVTILPAYTQDSIDDFFGNIDVSRCKPQSSLIF